MRFTSLVLTLAIAACGGDDTNSGDGDGDGDGGVELDAGIDAEVNTCVLLDPDYGDLGPVTGAATAAPVDDKDPDGPQFLRLEIPLNQDAQPDVLVIELYDDGGAPFETGLMPGTYTIVDLQADIFDCGACVFMIADREAGQPDKFHMASSGTITLDAIDATPGTGQVTGSLSNVSLREITVSSAGQAVVEGGCETGLDSVSFDFTVAAEMAARPAAR